MSHVARRPHSKQVSVRKLLEKWPQFLDLGDVSGEHLHLDTENPRFRLEVLFDENPGSPVLEENAAATLLAPMAGSFLLEPGGTIRPGHEFSRVFVRIPPQDVNLYGAANLTYWRTDDGGGTMIAAAQVPAADLIRTFGVEEVLHLHAGTPEKQPGIEPPARLVIPAFSSRATDGWLTDTLDVANADTVNTVRLRQLCHMFELRRFRRLLVEIEVTRRSGNPLTADQRVPKFRLSNGDQWFIGSNLGTAPQTGKVVARINLGDPWNFAQFQNFTITGAGNTTATTHRVKMRFILDQGDPLYGDVIDARTIDMEDVNLAAGNVPVVASLPVGPRTRSVTWYAHNDSAAGHAMHWGRGEDLSAAAVNALASPAAGAHTFGTITSGGATRSIFINLMSVAAASTWRKIAMATVNA